MSTRPVTFPPPQPPKLADIALDASPNVRRAFIALDNFLGRLAAGQVQGLDAVSSPTLIRGDMIYNEGGGDARLPAGDDGQFLGLEDGLPEWQDLPDQLEEISGYDGVPVTDAQIRRLLEQLLMELMDIEQILASKR